MTLSEILSLDTRPKYITKASWAFERFSTNRLDTGHINLRLEVLVVNGSWSPSGAYLPTVRDMTATDWEVWKPKEASP